MDCISGIFRDPQQWDPLMVSFPYSSHTTPIRIPKDMGIVLETYHKGVPSLGVPGITLDCTIVNHHFSPPFGKLFLVHEISLSHRLGPKTNKSRICVDLLDFFNIRTLPEKAWDVLFCFRHVVIFEL